MNRLIFTGLLAALLTVAETTLDKKHVTFDQRQEGNVNVQIDVKDVRIIALVDSEVLEDYMNYDYGYDYADFTIRPSSKPTTTKRPLSNSSSSSNINDAIVTQKTSSASLTTETISSTLIGPTNDYTSGLFTNAEPSPSSNKFDEMKRMETGIVINGTTISNLNNEPKLPQKKIQLVVPEPRKHCPVGFQLKSGKCFKHRLSLIS